jgi:uncharacterized protein YjbI with pentapeptide repeats
MFKAVGAMSEKQADKRSYVARLKTRLAALIEAPRPEPMPEEPKYETYLEVAKNSSEAEIQFQADLNEFESGVERRKSFHDDASKTIRRVFYSLLGTCLFCVLTLAGTPDANLISAGSEVTLPILNYPIGFGDFLVVGPAVLIALTVYLHLFVAQHRMIAIPPKYRLAMLPNFDAMAARVTVWFAYYWLVPATLVYFLWKAWPRAFEGQLVFLESVLVVAVLAALQIRRCPSAWRLWAVPILIASIAVYAGGLYKSTSLRTLNLFKAELDGQDLRGANLSRAYLAEAKLHGANLSGANLFRADLREAKLSKANLSFASLHGALLRGANLSGSNLRGANLGEANLREANLREANLSGADMRRADMRRADLGQAILSRADLRDLRWAGLIGAGISGGGPAGEHYLSGANLRGANLSGANLRGADLREADLREANLSGAWLRETLGLSQTQLDEACGDTETTLPEGFTVAECEPDGSEPKE